jgi:hypothetical protein
MIIPLWRPVDRFNLRLRMMCRAVISPTENSINGAVMMCALSVHGSGRIRSSSQQWWQRNRGAWGSPVSKMDLPRLPKFFQGTTLQWRRCVRPCTSTVPWSPMRGHQSGIP